MVGAAAPREFFGQHGLDRWHGQRVGHGGVVGQLLEREARHLVGQALARQVGERLLSPGVEYAGDPGFGVGGGDAIRGGELQTGDRAAVDKAGAGGRVGRCATNRGASQVQVRGVGRLQLRGPRGGVRAAGVPV